MYQPVKGIHEPAPDLITMGLTVYKPPKKVPPLCKYAWVQAGAGYRLEAPHVLATLKPLNDIGGWRMALKYRGKWHTGTRQGLESAFKAIDGLLARKSKAVWLETNVRAVIEPWMGDLNFDVDKPIDCDILEEDGK